MKQEKNCQTFNSIQSTMKETANLLETRAKQTRNVIYRTCKELNQADPSLVSGMYWIDPDGQGVGDDPIYVNCDMKTGQ